MIDDRAAVPALLETDPDAAEERGEEESATLQGNTDNQLMRIRNTGTGAALSLVAGKGAPPLTTNSSVNIDKLNAGMLDGKDAADFLPIDGKAVSASTADNATQVGVAGLLDGFDSSAFVQHDEIYRISVETDGQTLGGPQTCADDALCFHRVNCGAGEKVITGGFGGMDSGTRLEASQPGQDLDEGSPASFGWVVRWVNNSTEDTITVTAICADI